MLNTEFGRSHIRRIKATEKNSHMQNICGRIFPDFRPRLHMRKGKGDWDKGLTCISKDFGLLLQKS